MFWSHPLILAASVFASGAQAFHATLRSPMRGLTTLSAERGTVGFVGLGIMGNGMARRLLKSGRGLVVWNRSEQAYSSLVAESPENVEVVATAREVVEKCTLTYVMLSDHDASNNVYFDPKCGLLRGLSEAQSQSTSSRAIIDAATLSVEHMEGLEREVVSRGAKFLEAPVSGSKGPAANGQLIFLCGGSKELFGDAMVGQDLAAMGKASYHFGPVGAGTRMKLVANMVMGNMLVSLGEGLRLADAAGLPQDELVEVLGLGSMANPLFSLKGPQMVAHSHPPNFPLKHATKDMKLAADLAIQVIAPALSWPLLSS